VSSLAAEREVRQTIVRLIADHLRISPNDTTRMGWHGYTLDFSSVVFDGSFDFMGAKFSGGQVLFHGAEFSGGRVSFGDAGFYGGRVSFGRAKFSGGQVSFYDSKFSGGEVSFDDAEFSGGTVDLSRPASWDNPPQFDKAAASAPGLVLPRVAT
jgi:hypothetical protein